MFYVYMVLSPKWKATLLQLLYQCAAHTLPFSVWFQNILQLFARSTANWKMEIQKFYLRNQGESSRYMSNLFVSLHQELLIIIAGLSLWFSSMADWHSGHSVGPWRPLHLPGKWLSRHTKLSSIFTQLLPSTMCVCFEHPVSIPLAGTIKLCTLPKCIHVFLTIHEISTDCPFN